MTKDKIVRIRSPKRCEICHVHAANIMWDVRSLVQSLDFPGWRLPEGLPGDLVNVNMARSKGVRIGFKAGPPGGSRGLKRSGSLRMDAGRFADTPRLSAPVPSEARSKLGRGVRIGPILVPAMIDSIGWRPAVSKSWGRDGQRQRLVLPDFERPYPLGKGTVARPSIPSASDPDSRGDSSTLAIGTSIVHGQTVRLARQVFCKVAQLIFR